MTRPTQGLLMAFLGAVLIRLAFTDAYLRYVVSWMKWPILVSGIILVLLAVGLVLSSERRDARGQTAEDAEHPGDAHAGHGHAKHGVPMVTWLLVLPGLVTFVISPPQLGSFLAERRAGDAVPVAEPAALTELNSAQAVDVDVTEFIWRAQDGGTTLVDQPVRLTGFVSYDKDDNWYVTRMTIGCCAADALGYQVEVEDAEAPPRDAWVAVEGVYVPETGTDGVSSPAMVATSVTPVEAPPQTYE